MKPGQDAFGDEIFACFQLLQAGDQEPAIDEIVEREDGFISVSAALKIYSYRLVSPPEMEHIIEDTGWEVERFIYAEQGPVYIGILASQAGS